MWEMLEIPYVLLPLLIYIAYMTAGNPGQRFSMAIDRDAVPIYKCSLPLDFSK